LTRGFGYFYLGQRAGFAVFFGLMFQAPREDCRGGSLLSYIGCHSVHATASRANQKEILATVIAGRTCAS
jgi:hypothetical protein